MSNKNFPVVVRQAWNKSLQHAQKAGKNPWVRLSFLSAFIFFLSQKEFSFHFSMGENKAYAANILDTGIGSEKAQPVALKEQEEKVEKKEKPQRKNISPSNQNWWDEIRDNSGDIRKRLNLANEATAVGAALSEDEKAMAARISNLAVVFNQEYFKKKNIPASVVEAKRKTCENYISKYLKTAEEEAEMFNIPVSITLAQGLLESNAGDSQLSKKENNHFGIKCKTKCLGCRCANYTDDDKYDMFRIFDSAWHSFREHSKLLAGDRYKHLSKLDRSDYKNWARGLKSAGYATDKNYAEKLIEIIEFFKLYKYDR
jgi:flagellum-specific peptidoglycan hydrolase FlgJ